MTVPSAIFGILISTLYGALFHLWRGGGAGRLLLYLMLSWAGFWVGHLVGQILGWSFAHLGPLNLGMASVSSAVFLLIGHWLSLVEIEPE